MVQNFITFPVSSSPASSQWTQSGHIDLENSSSFKILQAIISVSQSMGCSWWHVSLGSRKTLDSCSVYHFLALETQACFLSS